MHAVFGIIKEKVVGRFYRRDGQLVCDVYYPVDMLDEIQKEALRQDRTVSWIVQRAWKIARDEILLYPSINDPTGEELQAIMAATSEDKDKEE